MNHRDHYDWLYYLSTFFVIGSGFALIVGSTICLRLLLPRKLLMSFNRIQRYITRINLKTWYFDGVMHPNKKQKAIRIDLRTMRPSEKQKVVDRLRREYVPDQITWEPADATEIWIKESRGGELFKEFVARLLQKQALVEQRLNEPEPTVAHPVIQALADVNTEARRVVWTLGDQVAYNNMSEGE